MMTRDLAVPSFDQDRVEAIFSRFDHDDLPGVAVGIAIDGAPVYCRGLGLANVELPVPLSPAMRMRIGSATKHFTALAYILLCEDGLAKLDDEVGKFLPELHPVVGAATIRRLITHTSGLRDVFELGMVFSGACHSVAADQYVDLYRTIDHVNARPGTVWSYNNGGYVLLTAAIERITGKPLEEVLRSRIFEPVGMADTMLRRWDSDFIPNSATLHVAEAGGSYSRRYMGMALGGEGGMVSTIDDMLRWLKHMDGPVVGTPETWAAMTSPMHLVNGASTGYGLGLMLHPYRGVATIGHPGTVFGGNSQMMKVPAAGLDVVVLANRSDVSTVRLTEQVIDALLPSSVHAPAHTFYAPFNGRYFAPGSETVIELEADNGQSVTINGAEASVRSDGALLAPTAPAMAGFRIAPPADDVTAIVLFTFGVGEPAERLVAPTSAVGDEISGQYALSAPPISLRIQGNRMFSIGPFGTAEFTLEQLGADIWRFHPVENWPTGGILRFAPDRHSFAVSTGRTSQLIFKRCQMDPTNNASTGENA